MNDATQIAELCADNFLSQIQRTLHKEAVVLEKVSHRGAGPVEGTQEQQISNQFSDFEKGKNFTNGADPIGVVTVALEENNGHAGTNHHLSIFMKSCVEGNGSHLPRRAV